MKTALIIGSNSDIAKGLMPLLKADGYQIRRWSRNHHDYLKFKNKYWDLCIVAIGSVAPVGYWWEQDADEWEASIRANLLLPIRVLRRYWSARRNGASICFLAGSNPNMIMDGYSAYNCGKMALLKACEQLDHETKDAKFFALAPGTIITKIHGPTLKADWDNPKLDVAMSNHANGDKAKKIQRVYNCLQWCIRQDKAVIGGRNICVSDEWEEDDKLFAEWLRKYPDGLKLRRMES